VIVNFNGQRFLEACITSIRDHVVCRHEVIMVDNASVDNSVALMEALFPHVRLIKSAINTGFTGGNNLGVDHARGDLVLLLNNDTRLIGPIGEAVAAFDNPKLGALGVHLFYGDGRNQASVGYEHTPLRMVLTWAGLSRYAALHSVFRLNEYQPAFYDEPHERVAWVSGAFLMTRRSLWRTIGGLDARYFMYVEDVDYCKQVRLQGFDVGYLPQVHVTHYEGSGKAWIGQAALCRTARSYRIFLGKHYGPAMAALTCLCIAAVLALRVPLYAVRYRLKGSVIDQEKARGYVAAAKQALTRLEG
jgi:GT2 family glycosyltransferase